MGWDPSASSGAREFLHPQHAGRHPRAGRHARRARLSHRPLGSRPADGGRGATSCSSSARMPFAGFCTDPCDGRTQGTAGMMDSLPYRNDAAIVLRRLIRSLPTRARRARRRDLRQGPAGDDDGAGRHARPAVRAGARRRDAAADGRRGRRQGADASARASRTARSRSSEAAELGCRACGSPGGGCQFLGTAATSQVVAEALGLSLPHSALAPSGQPIWLDMAHGGRRARCRGARGAAASPSRDILTDAPLRNAMVVHAAFGGSTNLLLHMPAIAHAAGLRRPTRRRLDRGQPRGAAAGRRAAERPVHHPTVRVFLAGGVPEVMLHLRRLGLLDLDVPDRDRPSRSGDVLDWWEGSRAPRALARQLLAGARRRRSRRRDHDARRGARARA